MQQGGALRVRSAECSGGGEEAVRVRGEWRGGRAWSLRVRHCAEWGGGKKRVLAAK